MGIENPKFEKPQEIKEYTVEQQEIFFELLNERVKTEKNILTDDNLVELTRKTSQESGLKSDVFDNLDRPKIFYRAFRPTEIVKKLLEKDENIQRPFMYSLPGTQGDLPLSYGGENPILIRIIDTGGEWEDTGKYWGFGENWKEAMNLDPVVLKKLNERTMEANDLYKQVGAEGIDVGPQKINQVTYIVDKIETEKLQQAKTLEPFINDVGFWKEISERAKKFRPAGENEHLQKLNKKYLEYFDQTMKLDENKAGTEEAKKALIKAKEEIQKLTKNL